MDRRAVVRQLMFGALVTGLVPLTSAGVGGAAADESPAGLCSSRFGERGPADGPVVGEGPPGDPMPVTIAWNPAEWPDGLRDIVTCVSIDGRAAPALTAAHGAPANSGTLNFDLSLPPGDPGAVVCQQSILVGSSASGDVRRPTASMCFKLRAADVPPAEQSGGYTIGDTPVTPPVTPPARTYAGTPPARTYAGTPPARIATGARPPAVSLPAPPAGAPPAEASADARLADPVKVEAPRAAGPAKVEAPGAAGPAKAAAPPAAGRGSTPGANGWANRRTPLSKTPAHLLPGAWASPSGRGPLGPISWPSRRARAAAAAEGSADSALPARAPVEAALIAGRFPIQPGNPHPAPAPPAAGETTGPASSASDGVEVPRAALPRTGITDRIPLAAAGALLAVGGAAIVLAEPRRRARPARAR